jgi:hypothetical protein
MNVTVDAWTKTSMSGLNKDRRSTPNICDAWLHEDNRTQHECVTGMLCTAPPHARLGILTQGLGVK